MITAIVVAVLVVLGAGSVALMNNDKETSKKTADSKPSSTVAENKSTEQSSTSTEDTNKVTYKDFEVVQKTIKVKKGTTVTWTNKDNAKHDVTPVNPTDEFKTSELFGKGETYTVTFNTVGSYDYFCSPHPYMKGTIEVIE